MDTPPGSTDLESLQVEKRSAHAREEATREILHLLIQSREDQSPVFDAVLKNATRLCNAPIAGLFLTNEAKTKYELVASRGAKHQFVEAFKEDPPDLDPERFAAARAMIEQRVVHVEDLASPTLYGADAAHRIVCTQTEGVRTTLFVPLIWNDQSIGAIGVWRREVRPFHDDEINLVETFAAQAVIAIDNVRQFKEVQARLTREQALAEILAVISESRDDEKPVFDAILQNATRLCQASDAALLLGRPDEPNITLAALLREDASRPEQNVEVIAETNRVPMKMDPAIHTSAEAICSGTIVHILDLSESAGYQAGEPSFRSMVDDFGIRTCLSVPLFDAQGALGAINLHRRSPKSFSEDEIALVKSFAAHAVIAIENVRQFRELQERLEREEATRDVLQVISMSRSDPTPVFDVILKNAARLSGAPLANLCLLNSERSHWRLAAHFGEGLRHLSVGKTSPLESDLVPAVTIRTGRVNHIEDLTESDLYLQGDPGRVAMVEAEGMRSILCVPLLSAAGAIGCITLFRRETKAFSSDEIALVETFAAQAVIAIENLGQFRALADRTAEVEALNSSLETRVSEQVGEIERMGRLKRFLPPAVADTVVSSGSEKMLSSHRALLGVLFCDIRGFTAFCETAEPEETIEVLQTYHQEMGKLINAHGAGVDHRMGDGIMVLFNDPLPCDDPAGYAVRLAIAMRARMADLCKAWKRMGYRLGFGVGVSLGYATVGMVGFEGRFDYTASGTAINLASRLCDEAEDGEILLSPRAAIAVEDAYHLESRGELSLKGLREPLEVFRLTRTETR